MKLTRALVQHEVSAESFALDGYHVLVLRKPWSEERLVTAGSNAGCEQRHSTSTNTTQSLLQPLHSHLNDYQILS